MKDLIERQTVIESIRECAEAAHDNHEWDMEQGYWNAIECIEEEPSEQSEQRWIPCSEGLPEKDGNYLVTFEEGYAEDYGFDSIGIAPFEVDCEGFGIWQEEFDRYTLGSLGSDWVEIKVIAWMPLPEPYKGGQDGQTN